MLAMLIDRRSLVTTLAAAGLGVIPPLPSASAVRIKHTEMPNRPLVWICCGWLPIGGSPARVYSVAAQYSEYSIERLGRERVIADVESYVRRQLTNPFTRAKHIRSPYDAIEARLPWETRDGLLNWDCEINTGA